MYETGNEHVAVIPSPMHGWLCPSSPAGYRRSSKPELSYLSAEITQNIARAHYPENVHGTANQQRLARPGLDPARESHAPRLCISKLCRPNVEKGVSLILFDQTSFGSTLSHGGLEWLGFHPDCGISRREPGMSCSV